MNKIKVVSYLAVMVAIVGGVAFGFTQLKPSVAHAQTPVMQVQPSVSTVVNDKEVVDTNEPAEGTETKDSAGHQDASGSVDHQFEGVE